VDDTLWALAALHGQTLFAAAGDVLAGCAAQQYPASSPYAVAVGATTPLVPSIGSGPIGEVAWTLTAGGPSDTEAAPFWQANIAPAAAAAADARAVPDITLDGDPNTGTPTIVRGGGIQLGGTSLGAALALGLWGRLETGQHNRLGFGSPRLYREFATFRTPADARPNPAAIEQSIGGFRDLLVGTSVVAAGPEDDFASGLGSLDLHLQADDIQP
jgi:subtilase family serine protease